MRKIVRCGISILLAVSMVFPVCGEDSGFHTVHYAAAAEIDSESMIEYTLSGSQATVIGYAGSDTSLVIPSRIQEYEVKEIANQAFKGNQNITEVVIPEGVTTIGYQAFYGCENLQDVTIPSTITTWSEESYNNSAFEGCTGLSSLSLSNGLSILGQRAFAGCISLETVSIPAGIRQFRNCVFEGCTGLKKVELPEGITQIGYRAFMGCISLKEVSVPSTITGWPLVRSNGVAAQPHDNECFRGCTSLEKLTFADGVTTLANFNGIKECLKLKEIEVPGTVEDVTYAFRNCASLEKVVMQPGIQVIGESAFSDCTSLKNVSIPNTVTQVDYRAFYNCSSIETLVFPTSVTRFANAVTSGCDSLQRCYILADDVERYQRFAMGEGGKLYCVPGSKTYDMFLENMRSDGREESMAVCPPVQGVEVREYSAVYDGEEHDAVVVTGKKEGDEIQYSLDGEKCDGVPKVRDVGSYSVKVTVIRMNDDDGGLPYASCWTLEPQIQKKKDQTIRLKDMEVREKETYEVKPDFFEGDGDIVYHYYEDEALTKELSDKPTERGVYYVQGKVEETENYAAAVSNVARITILANLPEQSPDVTPSLAPDQSPVPDSQASAAPDTELDDSRKPAVEKVELKQLKSTAKKTLEIQWKKCAGVTGYEVWVGSNKKFTQDKKTYLVKSNKTVKKKINKLKSKTKYYVKVRAYRVVKGKRYYGAFSAIKSVQIK